MAPRLGRQFCRGLTATAAIPLTAAVIAAAQIAAAIAEQDDQQDDPAQIATAEIVITHTSYLQVLMAAEPLIPCYSMASKMCGPWKLTLGNSWLIMKAINFWR